MNKETTPDVMNPCMAVLAIELFFRVTVPATFGMKFRIKSSPKTMGAKLITKAYNVYGLIQERNSVSFVGFDVNITPLNQPTQVENLNPGKSMVAQY